MDYSIVNFRFLFPALICTYNFCGQSESVEAKTMRVFVMLHDDEMTEMCVKVGEVFAATKPINHIIQRKLFSIIHAVELVVL